MFPLSSTMELTQATSLGLALVIGLGFGFFLEKAGFGSTRKLAAVFYFYDMAVVKVMFTAIVTAMVGIFILSSAGALDLAELYIEPSNYPAAIIGGVVLRLRRVPLRLRHVARVLRQPGRDAPQPHGHPHGLVRAALHRLPRPRGLGHVARREEVRGAPPLTLHPHSTLRKK